MSLNFIQGLTEDSSPGDDLSVALRKLCQRGGREANSYMILGSRKYMQSSIRLGKRLLPVTKNRYSKLIILVLFYERQDARVWGHWNASWDIHPTIKGSVYPKHQVPHVVLHLNSSQSGQLRWVGTTLIEAGGEGCPFPLFTPELSTPAKCIIWENQLSFAAHLH